jgi:hypothetical protein
MTSSVREQKADRKQGEPVHWFLNPIAWGPGRIDAILRFMYHEGK